MHAYVFPDGLILNPGHLSYQPAIYPIQDASLRAGRLGYLPLDYPLQHRRQVVLVAYISLSSGGIRLASDGPLVLLEDVAEAELDRVVEFEEHVVDHQALLLSQPVVAMLHEDLQVHLEETQLSLRRVLHVLVTAQACTATTLRHVEAEPECLLDEVAERLSVYESLHE